MNKPSRIPYDIQKDLKIITSNKLSIYQSKLLLMGSLYEIILNKEIFKRNNDLKKFVNQDLNNYLKLDLYVKDYVFKSRTLLVAKVQRVIYEKAEYKDIVDFIYFLNNAIFYEKETKIKDKKNSLDEDKVINNWKNYIMNKDD